MIEIRKKIFTIPSLEDGGEPEYLCDLLITEDFIQIRRGELLFYSATLTYFCLSQFYTLPASHEQLVPPGKVLVKKFHHNGKRSYELIDEDGK